MNLFNSIPIPGFGEREPVAVERRGIPFRLPLIGSATQNTMAYLELQFPGITEEAEQNLAKVSDGTDKLEHTQQNSTSHPDKKVIYNLANGAFQATLRDEQTPNINTTKARQDVADAFDYLWRQQ